MATTAAKDPMSIRVVSRRLVKASDASIQPHVLSLSNLDLYVSDSQIGTLCVYPNAGGGGGFSPRIPTLFEALLPSLLNYLYPFAGRLVTNPSSGLPELHCHNQGAELVVGEVGVALGSLNYGSAKDSLKKMVLAFPKDVLLSVQVLSFACGGFSVMWWINHLVGDGHVGATIVNTWSRLVRTGEIDGGPLNHDRWVFRPRSPPWYRDSVAAIFTTYDERRLPNALTADASLVDRLYYVEASDIAALRDKAASTTGAKRRPTRVEALSAYLWKALADVVAASPRSAPKEHCRMGWWVSARRRLTAPKLAAVMPNYLGNVTTYTLGDAPAEEVTRKPLAEVAAMVRDAITSVDYDELVQEMVDLVEVHKAEGLMEATLIGVGAPTLNQSMMTTFPHDADFGFGQATMAMPVVSADSVRFCASFLSVMARPGGDGSWLVSAYIWPQLAAALESDGIFKPLTAEYLGLTLTQQEQDM
ncbi:putrescine hydroxycinnamoyltransferase 1-like [Miscanthus floridulus]|uniref:putrescine hydroxycinnamoyltransferase 1-like n=1 Tax=Miscanthus floridulus TaxID=154761 RepID=UPI0034598AD9